MSRRVEQIESTLRRAIGQVLARGLSDPRISGLVSVTQVTISQDRREALIGVSVMPEDQSKLTLRGLQHASRHIQADVAKLVRARQIPRFRFHLDDSIKRESQMLAAIRDAVGPEADADTGGDRETPPNDQTPSASAKDDTR